MNNQNQKSPYMLEEDITYLPIQVDSYLSNLSEWRNIQDIIRLSFKSLADIVRNQGITIKELEKQLNNKANKAEIESNLSTKANSSDVMRAFSDFATSIEQRPMIDEVRVLIEDKISKSDMIYYMASKPSKEEVKNMLDDKIDIAEFKAEMNEVNCKIDDFQKDFSKKISQFATCKDIAMVQGILNQKANQAEVNDALSTKANKDVVLSNLNKKSNKTDLDTILSNKVDKSEFVQIMNSFSTKVDNSTYEELQKTLENKADRNEIVEITKRIDNKAEVNDFKLISDAFQDIKGSLSKRIEDIDIDLDRLIENIKQQFQSVNVILNSLEANKVEYSQFDKINAVLNKKIDNDIMNNQINQVKGDIFEAITQFKQDIAQSKKKYEDKINEKVNAVIQDAKSAIGEVISQKESITTYISNKEKEKEGTTHTINLQLSNLTKDVRNECDNLKVTMMNELSLRPDKAQFEKMINIIEQKADYNELDKICNSLISKIEEVAELSEPRLKELEISLTKEISKKVSISEMNCVLNEKVSLNQLEQKVDKDDFNKLASLYSSLNDSICNKVDFTNFESVMRNNHLAIDDIQSELNQKANIKEIITLLKNKAEVDEVNKALIEIHNELDAKNSIEQFNVAMDNQAIINDVLCSENCIARWMWKSGHVKNGYAVPWEIQNTNTAPDNFIWEKDKTFVVISSPGIYELSLGFYVNKKPTIQILVNGEQIISAVNSASYVVHQSSGKLKGTGRHSLGNITGLTLVDYIMLPEKCKISISYSGDEGAIGFFSLKKI